MSISDNGTIFVDKNHKHLNGLVTDFINGHLISNDMICNISNINIKEGLKYRCGFGDNEFYVLRKDERYLRFKIDMNLVIKHEYEYNVNIYVVDFNNLNNIISEV